MTTALDSPGALIFKTKIIVRKVQKISFKAVATKKIVSLVRMDSSIEVKVQVVNSILINQVMQVKCQ